MYLGDLSINQTTENNEYIYQGTFQAHPKYRKCMVKQIASGGSVICPSSGDPYDVALVKLKSPATLNDYIRPAVLPPENYVPPENSDLVVAGS